MPKVEVALALRASNIMMRSKGSMAALTALAFLLFCSCGLLAVPTHHLVRRASTSRRFAVRGVRASSRSSARQESASPRAVAVRDSKRPSRRAAHELSVRSARRGGASRSPAARAAAGEARSRRAGSQDFLEAAPPQTQIPAALAIHGAARPDEPRERPSHVRGRRRGSVSRPVMVVSVIRPAAQTPRLKSVEEDASTPVILPSLYNKRGRLIVPRPLKGSHEILVHQNEVADRDGLSRIQNDDDLEGMRSRGLLVALPLNGGMGVDERLPVNRRYCRPWTAQFLANLSRAHYARFHTPLQVNSAVRTVEFQAHLMHINGNAAPVEGDTASPHLTGQAVDLAKHGLSLSEIAWMRGYLLPLVQEGKIDVEEEFQQSCFHISVYKHYLPPPDVPERDLASSHREGVAALATAVR